MDWAYGYGDADSALLLRVPDRDLTLVMLSNSAAPSATTMLGYGNPLNSPVAASFVKSFVLQGRVPAESIDYTDDIAAVEQRLAAITAESGSRLYLEEAFAYVMLMKLLPADMHEGEAKATRLLTAIDARFPDFLEERRVEAFDLVARFDDPTALRVGARLADAYRESGTNHSGEVLLLRPNL
jgi:hypothetical protein